MRLELRHLFFVILAMTILFGIVIRDPDLFFHLKAGEDILRQGAIPATDPYTFTHAGGAWHAHEWLFALLIHLLFDHFGYLGVKLLVALMGSGALLVSASALTRRHPLELPVIAALALLLVPFLAPRPQLFTYLFFAVYLFALLRYKYRAQTRHLWGLPLLMVVWVNVHGGYLLGIAIIAALIASEWLGGWLSPTPAAPRTRLRPLLLTLLAVIAASLLNPWGVHHWWFPFALMESSAVAVISEWQPLAFNTLLARGYLLALALLFIAYLYTPRRPDLTELLLPWAMVVASFTAVRHLPLALLAILPFLLHTLGAWLTSAPFQSHPWVARLRRGLAQGGELGGRESLLNGLILAVVAVLLVVSYPRYHADDAAKLNALVPARATDFIIAANLGGRLFNTYHYGGYLIFRLAPRQRVFIDIRGDMFGKELIDDYRTLYHAQPGWQALLDRYAIDTIVCESAAPLLAAATSAGLFATVYRDATSAVLVRNDGRQQALVDAYRGAVP